MTTPARFDRRHGKGAFLRLCAMLADPALAYQQIGDEFGLTRQRIFGSRQSWVSMGNSAVTIERSEFALSHHSTVQEIPASHSGGDG
jgi:hypothetical protein